MTPLSAQKKALLDAIVPHVPFDGWSQTAFQAAIDDSDINTAEAKVICPRGATDLAVAFHKQGDADMVAALKENDMTGMRFSEKVAHAIRMRLSVIPDKETVRRGTTLFSLPHMSPEGARLIWGTADAIWTALGDTSRDGNWYTKRATLSGVYGATILFWLGDDSTNDQATNAFIDRRIANVMQIEKVKGQIRENPVLGRVFAPLTNLMSAIKAPDPDYGNDLPGAWRR